MYAPSSPAYNPTNETPNGNINYNPIKDEEE